MVCKVPTALIGLNLVCIYAVAACVASFGDLPDVRRIAGDAAPLLEALPPGDGPGPGLGPSAAAADPLRARSAAGAAGSLPRRPVPAKPAVLTSAVLEVRVLAVVEAVLPRSGKRDLRSLISGLATPPCMLLPLASPIDGPECCAIGRVDTVEFANEPAGARSLSPCISASNDGSNMNGEGEVVRVVEPVPRVWLVCSAS
jgi:hypothetical protein